jgi:hypothetical protein
MPEFIPSYDDAAGIARDLARDIARKRRALDTEAQERIAARQQGLKGRSLPGRGSQHIRADRQRIDGMVDALTYLIGCPGEPWNAEQFITGQEHDQEEST